MFDQQQYHLVAVIGAGPAGLYAAQYLTRQGKGRRLSIPIDLSDEISPFPPAYHW